MDLNQGQILTKTILVSHDVDWYPGLFRSKWNTFFSLPWTERENEVKLDSTFFNHQNKKRKQASNSLYWLSAFSFENYLSDIF